MRSSDRLSKYEQTGDRESVTLIVIQRVRGFYGKVSLVWGVELPNLGGNAELHGLPGSLVP